MTTAQFDAGLGAAGFPAASSGAVYSGAPAPPSRTLWQILEATAAAFPRAAAIDDGRRVLDYQGLLEEVGRAGDRLALMGIGAGDRVGIRICSGTAELYLSILAVLSVGAAYVPVDKDDPEDRAGLVWSAAGVCAIIGDGGDLAWRESRPAGNAARRPVPEDDAWIIFTSGTTGTPKGVAVTHRSAAASLMPRRGCSCAAIRWVRGPGAGRAVGGLRCLLRGDVAGLAARRLPGAGPAFGRQDRA